MEKHSLLTHEELEALLGKEYKAKILLDGSSELPIDAERVWQLLRALTAKVEYLEQEVRDLKLSALQDAQPKQSPSEQKQVEPMLTESKQEPPAQRLSRMEKYGRR